MSVTDFSFRFDRLVVFACLVVVVAGIGSYLTFPSQEEPSIPVKEALVFAELPGADALRTEQLLAVPLEQALRQVDGVEHLTTTIRSSSVQVRVQAADRVVDLRPFFERLRAKVADLEPALPRETTGPFVNDDYGEVAVATIAVTAAGYDWAEMRRAVHALRDGVYQIGDVRRVTLHGLPGERVYIETDPLRLRSLGVSPAAIDAALSSRNVIAASGSLRLDGMAVYAAPTGAFRDIDAIRDTSIPAGGGRSIALRDVARVTRGVERPLQTAALLNGRPAVVLAVSMERGVDVQAFGKRLKAGVARLEPFLPAGFHLTYATFQADVVERSISEVANTLYQTIAVVLICTMLVLGWRGGLIVGLLVPLTMLTTLLVMRPLGIELHSVSIAAFIIALGILVDNGTVVAEDAVRRIAAGESRRAATIAAGRSLAFPLFIATAAAVLAFSPPVFSDAFAAQFLKGLTYVIGITLMVSWVLAVGIVPLATYHFIGKVSSAATSAEEDEARYRRGFYARYRGILAALVARPLLFLAVMVGALAAALVLLATLPQQFLTGSGRLQLQVPIELPAGTTSERTLEVVRWISRDLGSEQRFPGVTDVLAYVGEGGPRFILGLNPPDAAPHTAYIVVNLTEEARRADLVDRIRTHLRTTYPEVRARPAEFGLSGADPGTLQIRLQGPDLHRLLELSRMIQGRLTALPGTIDVRDDYENPLPRLSVRVDQTRARAAGVTTEDVFQALSADGDGAPVSVYRENDMLIPVVRRAAGPKLLSDLSSTLVFPARGEGGSPVPLSQIAELELVPEFAVIIRRDLVRKVNIFGRRPGDTATELRDALAPALAGLPIPPGYTLGYAGEIEDAEDANRAMFEHLPVAGALILALFLFQFNSFRKTLIVVACFPFCFIGVALALAIARVGIDFVALLGVLALAGTIVSNAILVLERNDAELTAGKAPYDALLDAAVKRLRPIFITQLTTIVGLVPFMLSDEPLWLAFNLVIVGGLTGGTLVSLGLVPVLYALLYRVRPEPRGRAEHA